MTNCNTIENFYFILKQNYERKIFLYAKSK